MIFGAEVFSLIGLMLSYAVVYLTLPRIARKLTKEGIVGRDMLKKSETVVPESGGIIIILAVVASLSIVTYLFTTTYKGEDPSQEEMQIWMLSAVATILGVGFIGLVDDYLNIPQKYKIVLPALAGLPLAFAFLERTDFWIPLLGSFNLGIFYPLLLIPIGITASSNLTNMYAGLNGLEIGCGLIACTFTFLAAAIIGRWSAVIVLAPMIGALAAFLMYNRFPARIFPGDVGTMAIGACLAVASIVGRIKMIAVVALIPFIINFLMYLVKARYFMANPDAKFASVREDGTLKPPEGGEFGSLYYTIMYFFRRGERWHVYIHYLLCTASGLAAILVGILIHGIGIASF